MSSSPSHPGQLSLSPSAERETRISQSAVMLCGWEWQVKLCDASLTRAIRDSLRDKQLIIKRYTMASFTFIFQPVTECVQSSIGEGLVDIVCQATK